MTYPHSTTLKEKQSLDDKLVASILESPARVEELLSAGATPQRKALFRLLSEPGSRNINLQTLTLVLKHLEATLDSSTLAAKHIRQGPSGDTREEVVAYGWEVYNCWVVDDNELLVLAVRDGDLARVKMLVGEGLRPNVRGADGKTALQVAQGLRRGDMVAVFHDTFGKAIIEPFGEDWFG